MDQSIEKPKRSRKEKLIERWGSEDKLVKDFANFLKKFFKGYFVGSALKSIEATEVVCVKHASLEATFTIDRIKRERLEAIEAFLKKACEAHEFISDLLIVMPGLSEGGDFAKLVVFVDTPLLRKFMQENWEDIWKILASKRLKEKYFRRSQAASLRLVTERCHVKTGDAPQFEKEISLEPLRPVERQEAHVGISSRFTAGPEIMQPSTHESTVFAQIYSQ